jgi:hypothetical protein
LNTVIEDIHAILEEKGKDIQVYDSHMKTYHVRKGIEMDDDSIFELEGGNEIRVRAFILENGRPSIVTDDDGWYDTHPLNNEIQHHLDILHCYVVLTEEGFTK